MEKLHQGTNWKKYLKAKKTKKIILSFPPDVYKRLLLLSHEMGMPLTDLALLAIIKFMGRKENRELIFQSDYDQADPLEKIFSET